MSQAPDNPAASPSDAFTANNAVGTYGTGAHAPMSLPLTKKNLAKHDRNEARLRATQVDNDDHQQRQSDRIKAIMRTLNVEVSDDIAKKIVRSQEGMLSKERFIAERNETEETQAQR